MANTTRSEKSGLTFPVGRVHRLLKQRALKCRTTSSKLRVGRVSNTAAIYVSAALEFLVTEVLDLSAEAVKRTKTKRVTPQVLNQTIRKDEFLSKLLKDVNIVNSGECGVYNEKLLNLSAKEYFQQLRASQKGEK
ncbi:Histone H2A [Spironucleus salmonicida]|uniref:Histone H2A n=1 Tax=Spironucleus salmonicida TaxID=348837 RepID=V6LIN0_9EUKA|nr:Histone H2A [Spironucleus salmonicida]|eukprot:EST44407.1 Histone H2A [Spironucleus salmonicida]